MISQYLRHKMNITVLVDGTAVPENDRDFTGNPDTPTTEHHVIQTLRELGHDVSILPVEEDIEEIVSILTKNKPDILFNLTEQFGGDIQIKSGQSGTTIRVEVNNE